MSDLVACKSRRNKTGFRGTRPSECHQYTHRLTLKRHKSRVSHYHNLCHFFFLFHHSFAGRSHAIIIFHSMILIRRGENYLSNNSLYVAIKYLDSEYRPIDQIGVRRPLIGRRNVDIDDMHTVWN